MRVKDGDTLVATLDQGFRDVKEIDVRLYGVYAPETHQTGHDETTAFVEAWFAGLPKSKWPFVVTTMRMKVADKEQTTLERYVATVSSIDGSCCLNVDVNAFLAEHKYPRGNG